MKKTVRIVVNVQAAQTIVNPAHHVKEGVLNQVACILEIALIVPTLAIVALVKIQTTYKKVALFIIVL
jgi:hypothetical protein